jgi:hypothetical protein
MDAVSGDNEIELDRRSGKQGGPSFHLSGRRLDENVAAGIEAVVDGLTVCPDGPAAAVKHRPPTPVPSRPSAGPSGRAGAGVVVVTQQDQRGLAALLQLPFRPVRLAREDDELDESGLSGC